MHLSQSARISVITLYWSAVALGSLALLFSMVSTLWGPSAPPAKATAAQRQVWCVGQLDLLHAELEHETQSALGPDSKSTEKIARRRQSWQRSWSERLSHVHGQCQKPEALNEALGQLANLARRYDAVVVGWQRAQDSLNAPIQAALRSLCDPWISGMSTEMRAP